MIKNAKVIQARQESYNQQLLIKTTKQLMQTGSNELKNPAVHHPDIWLD